MVVLERDFQVPFGDGGEDLALSEQEAKSYVARIAYRHGYEEGMRLERARADSLAKRTEISVRATSTRSVADFIGIFVAIPGGALMWALGGVVAGIATVLIAGFSCVFLLVKSERLRKQEAMLSSRLEQ